MDLKALNNAPSWDWPADTAKTLVSVLRHKQAAEPDRGLATEMAGDFTVVNEELVEALLAVLRCGDESEGLRGRAAISLGPILEYAETEGFEDAGDVPISEQTFRRIQESLRELYTDARIPRKVRRRILEASVRAPQAGDDTWKLTAVFYMRFVRGFDGVEELASSGSTDSHISRNALANAQLADSKRSSRGSSKKVIMIEVVDRKSAIPGGAGKAAVAGSLQRVADYGSTWIRKHYPVTEDLSHKSRFIQHL